METPSLFEVETPQYQVGGFPLFEVEILHGGVSLGGFHWTNLLVHTVYPILRKQHTKLCRLEIELFFEITVHKVKKSGIVKPRYPEL